MNINFVLPLWVLIAFGSVAYPSLGVMVANFLLRNSQKRMNGALVFGLSALWPVTLAGAVAAFPIWTVTWIARNYGTAIKGLLSGGGVNTITQDALFLIGQEVETVRPINMGGNQIPSGWLGRIVSQQGVSYKVDFGNGAVLVPQDAIRKSV